MKLPRRQFLHLAAGAAALPALSSIAWAQTVPQRTACSPRRLITAAPPTAEMAVCSPSVSITARR
jgi:hypothetical protein